MRKKNELKVPVEAFQALLVMQRCFGKSLLAVYLHGSAVMGGLRPNSDVDLLVIIDQPMTLAARKYLVVALMRISGRYPAPPDSARPLDIIIFQRADLVALTYPARSEFVYGEWLREAFEAGEIPDPVSDPEFTLLLAQAKHNTKTLFSAQATELLPDISQADIHDAIGDALPKLLDSLEGDERNVLLTLARMWRTLVEGDFVPKNMAAEWAIPRLAGEVASLLAHAQEGYLSRKNDDWSLKQKKVRQVANILGEHIIALL